MKHRSYAEKLRDSRWQKKRLEILQRDNWTCRGCGKSESISGFHVHHTYYEKDLEPWEYPEFSLLTLCDECHKDRHYFEMQIKTAVSSLSAYEIMTLGYLLYSLPDNRENFLLAISDAAKLMNERDNSSVC